MFLLVIVGTGYFYRGPWCVIVELAVRCVLVGFGAVEDHASDTRDRAVIELTFCASGLRIRTLPL